MRHRNLPTPHAAFLLAWLLLLVPAGSVGTLSAQAAPEPRPLFTWRDALAVGAAAGATLAIMPFDRLTAERLQQPEVQENRMLGDVASVVRNVAAPGSVIIGAGLYTIGRLTGNERAAAMGLHGTEALVVGTMVGTVLKGAFGRARPYRDVTNPADFQLGRGYRRSGDYRSFPSGHSIAAFAAAAAVTAEVDTWWPQGSWAVGTLLYSGAALAGASRMYNNRHWASDVVIGAAIGTVAGLKVVQWHHRHPDNAMDRLFLGATIRGGGAGRGTVSLVVAPALR